MTFYIVSASLGILSYVALSSAEAAFSGYGGPLFAILSNLVATVVLVIGYLVLRHRFERRRVESMASSPVPHSVGSVAPSMPSAPGHPAMR